VQLEEDQKKRDKKRKCDPEFVDFPIKKSKSLQEKLASGVVPKILYKNVIALEGEIGVGKSTLSRLLKSKFSDHCEIYEEQTNEGFLKLFYGNPGKYGFAFQWGMLKTRIYQLRLAQHDAETSREPKNKFFIWDRSMIGDYIFAFWNHLQGSISKDEMQVYESEFGGSLRNLESIPFLKDINCFTFLNDEPSACKFRVEQHRRNESEQGIPLPYYEGIDDIHFSMMLGLLEKKIAKVLVLNWSEYDEAEEVLKGIIKTVAAKQKISSVSFTNQRPPKSQPQTLVYRSAEEITQAYDSINEAETPEEKSELFQGIRKVFMPSDVLTVNPRDKNVVLENLKPYGVTFYQNEYKRVVFYHISRFHDICFYKSK
jgi:deoxyadenosine/deoxycytidine kinase